jgi:hypothetical protein
MGSVVDGAHRLAASHAPLGGSVEAARFGLRPRMRRSESFDRNSPNFAPNPKTPRIYLNLTSASVLEVFIETKSQFSKGGINGW